MRGAGGCAAVAVTLAVVACGAFESGRSEPSTPSGPVVATTLADAGPEGAAPPASDAGSTCRSPSCAGTTGCIATSFEPPPANDDNPWEFVALGEGAKFEASSGALEMRSDHDEVFLSNGVTNAPHLRLTVEMNVRVDMVAPASRVAVAAWVGPMSDQLAITLGADNDVRLCILANAGGVVATDQCSSPLARWELGAWHHVRWVVEAAVGNPATSQIAFDCGPAVQLPPQALALASTSNTRTLYLHLGAAIVYGDRAPAKVAIDDVYRRVEELP